MIKAKSADGVEGFLIYNGWDNYNFRIYHDDGTFDDYAVLHCDLGITVKDVDAFFYERDGKKYLDHAPDTLGITHKVDIQV